MTVTFYIASAVALAAAAVGVTRPSAVHGLLFLAIALVAVGVVLLALEAPLLAAFHVIVYAGAIVVLFLFAVMTAGLSHPAIAGERTQLGGRALAWPAIAGAAWAGALAAASARADGEVVLPAAEPAALSLALFEPYLAGVLLAALLLFAALIAAHHIAGRGSRAPRAPEGEP